MCIREKYIILLLSLVRSMQVIRLWSNSNSLVFAKCKCALDFQFITFTKYRLITVKYAMRWGKHISSALNNTSSRSAPAAAAHVLLSLFEAFHSKCPHASDIWGRAFFPLQLPLGPFSKASYWEIYRPNRKVPAFGDWWVLILYSVCHKSLFSKNDRRIV